MQKVQRLTYLKKVKMKNGLVTYILELHLAFQLVYRHRTQIIGKKWYKYNLT